ncbi:hypothetical protein NUW58_g5725 [Xylaria curta]|uniref:Uncharacterized protein n=1 Tax=Xylaria curta TaxID=42375 RepID=A0ACC1P1R1_9PEZI|nr:hypothetical protein NUW58_g5725 [Xylaria curta]
MFRIGWNGKGMSIPTYNHMCAPLNTAYLNLSNHAMDGFSMKLIIIDANGSVTSAAAIALASMPLEIDGLQIRSHDSENEDDSDTASEANEGTFEDIGEPLHTNSAANPTLSTRYPFRAKALYSYKGYPKVPTELSFSKGEILHLVTWNRSGWLEASKENGEEGIAPNNYLSLIENEIDELSGKSSSRGSRESLERYPYRARAVYSYEADPADSNEMSFRFACATDMSLFGYDQGVFSGVVITQDYLDVHDLAGPERTNVRSIVTSIYTIGCFFGALLAFSIGEKLGRKKTVILGTVIMTIGAILQTTSFNVAHMIVGRIVTGIGNGINTATAPVWQTETSKIRNRGKLVVFELSMNIFGFMLSNWVNGLSFVGGPTGWRLPLALQLPFCALLFATVPWLPESPRWLLAHGRQEEATVILADLENKAINDPAVIVERQEIVFSVEYEREHAVKWRDLFSGQTTPGTKTVRRLLLGAGTQALQQFGGINVMSYYLPTLLIESVRLEDQLARLIAALASVSYLFASLIAAPMVERFGRRVMMVVSTSIQLICFILITVLLYFIEKPGYPFKNEVAKASVVWFFVYYIGFALGMLGIPWLYPTEINSLPMRTKGAAVATMTNWLTNFLVVEVTPIGIQNLGWRFYIIWAVINAVSLPIIWAFFPETANRSLEDLDGYYREDPPLIVIKNKDATSVRRPQKFAMTHSRDIEEVASTGLSKRLVREGNRNNL